MANFVLIFIVFISVTFGQLSKANTLEEVATEVTSNQTITYSNGVLNIQGHIDEKMVIQVLYYLILTASSEEFKNKFLALNSLEQAQVISEMTELDYEFNHFPLAKNKNLHTFSLNSNGGLVLQAMILSKIVKTLKLNTRVDNNKLCFSSCTLIFNYGKNRMAGENALFIYHQAELVFDNNTDCNDSVNISLCSDPLTKNLTEFSSNISKKHLSSELFQEFLMGKDIYVSGQYLQSKGILNQYFPCLDKNGNNQCSWSPFSEQAN